MARTKSSTGARSAGKRSGAVAGGSNNGGNRRGARREADQSIGVIDLARDRPIAAAAVAAGAAAAGLFLWSKRSQISSQLNNLSNQIGEWTENVRSDNEIGASGDDTGGVASSSGNPRPGGRRLGAVRAVSKTVSRNRLSGRTSGSAGTTTSAGVRAQPAVATQE